MINEELRAELKTKLEEEKAKLEDEIGKIAKPTGTSGDFETKFDEIGTDKDDSATEVEEYTDNLAVETSLESQLKDVIDALKRMEDGTYGICENCHEEIDIERLRIYPSAKVCIKCK
jgi:RNA polymerase-binding protein DksA